MIQSDKHIAVDSDDQIQHHRGSVTCCDVIHMDVCKLDDEDSCCGEVMLIVTGGLDKSIKIWTCAVDALSVCDAAFSFGAVNNATSGLNIDQIIETDTEKVTCLLTISGSKSNTSGHQAALSNVKFLDKGHTIMSTSVDGEVKFWDLSLLLRLHLTQIGLEQHVVKKNDTKKEYHANGERKHFIF